MRAKLDGLYCSDPYCECHAVVKEDQSNEWRERFEKEFPDFQDERGAEGILGTSTEVVAFIASEKQKSYEEGYQAAITNNKQSFYDNGR